MQKVVQELVDSVGLGNALEIVRRWGGRSLRVPLAVQHSDPLALTLGLVLARKLVQNFGGERLELPAERNALLDMRNEQIVAEVDRGESHSAVAHRYGISRAMVLKVLRTTGKRRETR